MEDNEPSRERATPSFEELADFIHEWAAIPRREAIMPETLFEDDLGITGDDGCELLEATEKRFGVCLSSPEEGYRRTFDLAPHEFLFHSEGLGWDLSDIVSLFRPSAMPSSIRAFRVGDLFEAI
jgi:acyl carrier protein